MRINNRMLTRTIRWGIGSIMVLMAAYIVLVLAGVAPQRFSCNSQREMKLTNIAGHDFEITYTNCDVLAKEEFVSVYISSTKDNRKWWVPEWLIRKKLLFRYDPAMPTDSLPSIRVSGQNRISISIPRVSSVIFASKKWENVSVDYQIGHVDYPGPHESNP